VPGLTRGILYAVTGLLIIYFTVITPSGKEALLKKWRGRGNSVHINIMVSGGQWTLCAIRPPWKRCGRPETQNGKYGRPYNNIID
jgi:hypothetical protein